MCTSQEWTQQNLPSVGHTSRMQIRARVSCESLARSASFDAPTKHSAAQKTQKSPLLLWLRKVRDNRQNLSSLRLHNYSTASKPEPLQDRCAANAEIHQKGNAIPHTGQ